MTTTTTYQADKAQESLTTRRAARARKALEVAAVCCLLGGAVGIHRALQMEQATDTMLCLAGSFGACVMVCYLYFRRE
ncbi:MAG TPA: hypothetical protein VNT26_11075 [Candidatus Sulfotelmatobacter sp.]|nr:hypothetical protein [Candidatus Sulfotelmatobacter sp.]